jgi:allophanate hydrolase
VTSVDLSSIATVRAALEAGATPSDVVGAVLDRQARSNAENVWISRPSPNELLDAADRLSRHGDRHGPLFGIPFAVKDNVDVAGFATTAGCPAFSYRPQTTAPCVARLLHAGALFVGKTNLDQFATGLVGTRSPYGIVRNVVDDRYVAGGSSSGSAVAVATGLVPFSLGTDTAGSGRVPAAVNGIVGIKPTPGMVSTDGIVPACRSFDCVSVFARSVAEGGEVLRQMTPAVAGPRPTDWGRIAVPADRDLTRCATEVAAAFTRVVDEFVRRGASLVEVDLSPFISAGQLLYEGAFVAERHDSVGRFVAAHPADVDPTVGGIVVAAAGVTEHDRVTDRARLASLRRATDAVWAEADSLVVPTVPFIPTVDEVLADPVAVNSRLGAYTSFVNPLGCCAVAVPAGWMDSGLPFGVTVVAQGGADGRAACVASRVEARFRADQSW